MKINWKFVLTVCLMVGRSMENSNSIGVDNHYTET